MSLDRRQFLGAAGLAAAGILLDPLATLSTRAAELQLPRDAFLIEQLHKMGVDGSGIFSSDNLPVSIEGLSGSRWELKLNGIDYTATEPQISSSIVRSRADAEPRLVTTTIPFSTGLPAHYKSHIGSVDQNGTLSTSLDRNPHALATYLLIDRYYDNKSVNAMLAVLELTKSMRETSIEPGEEFSYLSRARIGDLLESNIPLDGYGISAGKRVRMRAGGICLSVTTIAKMARVAEHQGLARITRRKPHSVASLQYFYNPDDPTPHQVDATAYYPSVDFRFQNITSQPLYIVPRVQIIPDGTIPTKYSGLEHASAILALSTTFQTTPPVQEDIDAISSQLTMFRSMRGI